MRYRKPKAEPTNKKAKYVVLIILVLVAIAFIIWCMSWGSSQLQKGGYVDMTVINEADPTEDIYVVFEEEMNHAYIYQYTFTGSVSNGEVKVDIYTEEGRQIDSVTVKEKDINYESPEFQGEDTSLFVAITAPAGTTGIIQHDYNMTCRNITRLSEQIHDMFEKPENPPTEEENNER